jgi:hypothetical protein
MKINFKACSKNSAEMIFHHTTHESTLVDILGREVWIGLLQNEMSEKLKKGMSCVIELPDQQAAVTIQDITSDDGWMRLHCISENIFPAIVIGRHALKHAI